MSTIYQAQQTILIWSPLGLPPFVIAQHFDDDVATADFQTTERVTSTSKFGHTVFSVTVDFSGFIEATLQPTSAVAKRLKALMDAQEAAMLTGQSFPVGPLIYKSPRAQGDMAKLVEASLQSLSPVESRAAGPSPMVARWVGGPLLKQLVE